MPFSTWKKHFLKKMTIWPPAQRSTAPMSRNFFPGGNFTPIFETKKLRKVEEKCPGHFDSSQFSPKSAIFGGFEKKSFQKWLEPKTYCVCYPNTLLYMVLDHLLAKKCHNLGQKPYFSIFQKLTFLAVLRGFGGQIEIARQVLRYVWSQ